MPVGDVLNSIEGIFFSGGQARGTEVWIDAITVEIDGIDDPAPMCDFNSDTACNDLDIDLLAAAIRNGTSDAKFNVNAIGGDVPDQADFDFYLTDASMLSTGFADGNLDRVVNFDDFVLLTNNFNMSPTGWAQGNYNTDDNTNFNDFVILTNNFNMSFGSDGTHVPEPTAAVLLAFGALALVRTLGISGV